MPASKEMVSRVAEIAHLFINFKISQMMCYSIGTSQKRKTTKISVCLYIFRQCTPLLKIANFVLCFTFTFQQTAHKPLNIDKYDEYYYERKHM